MLTLLLGLVATSAHAREIAVELPIRGEPMSAHKYVTTAKRAKDVVVPSSHPSVTCAIEHGRVMVSYSAAGGAPPPSLPFSAVCSPGKYDLVVEVVEDDWVYTKGHATDPVYGMPIIGPDMALRFTLPEGHYFVQAYLLPEGEHAYVAGAYDSTLSSVVCKVRNLEAGHQVLELWVKGEAEMGRGTCVIPTEGPSRVVDIDLDEAPL